MIFSLRRIILIIGLLMIQVFSACAAKKSPTNEMNPSLPSAHVTIANSEVRHLKSAATGRDYDIYIRLPDEYVPGNGRKYPVLYVLDGQWDFKLLDSIYGGLYYDKFVPEMIIVGITYSGDKPDYNTLRALDYTPVHDVLFGATGEGAKFYAFLKEQLLPYVESNYPVDPSQRVLMGSSFGGTFTLYALFTEPTLFSGYIAGSPTVVFGDGFAFKQEAKYAGNHKDLPVKLFLSVGELEDLAGPVQQFMQVLKNRDYTGFQLETRIIEGERHASNKPESYNRGLKFIFQDE
jgi:predicted alpha/beta superfamily hydrolase